MKRTMLVLLILGILILPGCKGGGGDDPSASVGAVALVPTVEGAVGPLDNACVKYPDGVHEVNINPRFISDPGTICGLRLCWSCGECFYACPEDLLPSSCRR